MPGSTKAPEGFTRYLYQTGIKDSSSLPGYRGAQVFFLTLDGKAEITLIPYWPYWDTLNAIEAFAGEAIDRARLYPEDDAYELEPDLSVQHYEVVERRFEPTPL